MNRRHAVPLVAAALVGCLATAAPALAADQANVLSPLGTHLKYRTSPRAQT